MLSGVRTIVRGDNMLRQTKSHVAYILPRKNLSLVVESALYTFHFRDPCIAVVVQYVPRCIWSDSCCNTQKFNSYQAFRFRMSTKASGMACMVVVILWNDVVPKQQNYSQRSILPALYCCSS